MARRFVRRIVERKDPIMKKRVKRAAVGGAALIAAACLVCFAIPVFADNTVMPAAGPAFEENAAAMQFFNVDAYENIRLDLASASLNGQPVQLRDGAAALEAGDSLSLNVPVRTQGRYLLVLEYRPVQPRVVDCGLSLTLDDTAYEGAVPLLWRDAVRDYAQDAYGNDLLPDQAGVTAFTANPVKNAQSVSRETLLFELSPGTHRLTLETLEQKLDIRGVYLAAYADAVPYAAYAAENAGKPDGGGGFVAVEGEKYALKSDSFIHGVSVKNPALSPYDTYARRINVLDGSSWSSASQKVQWAFDAPESGYYRLGFRYAQSGAPNKPSYRQIQIDGKPLFQELEAAAFPYTKGKGYGNLVLGAPDGTPYAVYLTKGAHVLSLAVTLEPVRNAYRRMQAVMDRITSLYTSIQSVTSGVEDENRTWNMEVYFPGTLEEIAKCAEEIDGIYRELEELAGSEPVYANDLKYASQVLRTLLEEPAKIPNKNDLLSNGDQSANKYLGNVLAVLVAQPLSLDRLYLFSEGDLPGADAGFFTNAAENVKAFVYSFLPSAAQADYAASFDDSSDTLKVWMNRPVQYVQVLQHLVNADYNVKHDTNIQISIMPNQQKLIMSNAAGMNPDVALSLSYNTPFDFAVRGAAKNLLEYDDFASFYNTHYNLESLVPMCYQDGVFGAAETLDFQVLFYRKDILKSLGLSVPDTWDDVKRMMPVLLRNSMNFSIPIATGGGYKGFRQTSPFIYQSGGEFYAGDGASAALNAADTISGFKQMTDIFNIYGAQIVVPNFYNSFRFGQTPIGISNFSTYLQLQVAAPELTGRWGIALTPGQPQPDGSVLRYQPADSTACMIFANTKKSEAAYDFLKWWLSPETQTQYSYSLESTLGASYRWNTANLTAFSQLAYPKADSEVILAQLKAQRETIRHPAYYMVERETSNVWNDVVVDGKELTVSIDDAQLESNREILAKLEEFGYIGADGELLKPYENGVVDKIRAALAEEAKK